MVASALISAGGSLLGGMFGKSKSYSPRQMAVGNVEGLMQAADLFKINPLTLLNAGLSPSAMAGSNYMGSAIADAGLALADGMQRKAAEDSRIQELEKEKEELQKKVVDLTIRPKVGGIYSGNHMVPSLRQALGVADDPSGVRSPLSSAALRRGDEPVPFGPLSGLDGADSVNWPDESIRSGSDDASRVPQKPMYVLGMELPPTSGSSDAEAIGERYGEDFLSPSWFAGWGAFAHDAANAAAWNLSGYYADRYYSKSRGGTRPAPARPFGEPDGYTADGKPFWKTQDGITFKPRKRVN